MGLLFYVPCTKYRSIKRSVVFKERYLSTRSRNQSKWQGKKKAPTAKLLVWVWLIVKEGTSVPPEFLGLKEENPISALQAIHANL